MVFALLMMFCFAAATHAQSPFATGFQAALDAGRLADAEKLARTAVDQNAGDVPARFALGVAQSLQGLEKLSQDLYRYGADSKITRTIGLPMLRVPVPDNPNPTPLTYEQFRKTIGDVIGHFDDAQKTLEAIHDPAVMLPLRLDSIRLDLTGDGKTEPAPLAMIFGIARSMTDEPTTQTAEPFVLHLDAGDAAWLRGYCHLLSAFGNAVLAYDERELFDTTAQLFFVNPKTNHPYLNHYGNAEGGFDTPLILDAIALIHQLHLPLAEPKRMLATRDGFKAMLACSRESWKAILAETDDDHEWIPNPKQKSPFPAMTVNQERIDAWLRFVDESNALFDGKVLLPFWRGNDPTTGVNLGKVFTEPRLFDLVLWVQGSAAGPYLEKGTITNKDVYDNLMRVFEGNALMYGAWFN